MKASNIINMVKRSVSVVLLSSVLLMSGCIAFLASQAGLANAKAKYSKLYESYKEEQEEANSCRLQSGLAVVPVKEYGEWLRDQPLSDNEIKVFRMYGVITSDEARDIKEKEELSR